MSLSVGAVILTFNRPADVATVLDRLDGLPLEEVLVADTGSGEGRALVDARGGRVRWIDCRGEPGTAGRNVAARVARSDLLVLLDDDSYPLPGAIEALRDAFARRPRLGAAGGLVTDVDAAGNVLLSHEPGTFDWFLRGAHRGATGPDGIAAFFFPEGGCMVRREALLEVGGFFAPYFLTVAEIDVATRMLGAGWDVRYLDAAAFHHFKAPGARDQAQTLRLRVRNQIWYFWLRFPAALAARRIPAYLLFDLVECAYRGALGSWVAGVRDAWRERDRVRRYRAPVSREAARRAELDRGRLHVRLLAHQLARRLPRWGAPTA